MNDRPNRRWWLRPWAIALWVLLALVVWNYWPIGPTKIVISRETTFIEGPLHDDGTPNYVGYLDEKCSRGVTPENNAAPLLLRALGAEMLPEARRNETLSRLGMSEDDFDPNGLFVEWEDRARPGGAEDAHAADDSVEDEPDEPNLPDVIDQLRKGQVHPDLDVWLADNAAALDLLRQASRKSKLYLPVTASGDPPNAMGIWSIHYMPYWAAAQAMAAEAMLRANQGDAAGAWEDVLALHRIARLQQPVSLVETAFAINMEVLAAECGTALATRYPLTGDQAQAVLKDLTDLPPMPDPIEAIDKGERFLSLDAIVALSRGTDTVHLIEDMRALQSGSNPDGLIHSKPPEALNLDWNRMLRRVNPWYDRMVADLRTLDPRQRKKAREDFTRDIRDVSCRSMADTEAFKMHAMYRVGGRLFRGPVSDRYADLLTAILLLDPYSFVDHRDRARGMRDVETVAAALACYRAEHGRWPVELADLAPDILQAVPQDVFSGGPLVYRPREDGYLLYGVGKNLRDDGGENDTPAPGDPHEKTDDIVAEAPAPGVRPPTTKNADAQSGEARS